MGGQRSTLSSPTAPHPAPCFGMALLSPWAESPGRGVWFGARSVIRESSMALRLGLLGKMPFSACVFFFLGSRAVGTKKASRPWQPACVEECLRMKLTEREAEVMMAKDAEFSWRHCTCASGSQFC